MARRTAYLLFILVSASRSVEAQICESSRLTGLLERGVCRLVDADKIKDRWARSVQYCNALRILTRAGASDDEHKCALAAALYRLDRHTEAAQFLGGLHCEKRVQPALASALDWGMVAHSLATASSNQSRTLTFPESALDRLILKDGDGEARLVYCSRVSDPSEPGSSSVVRNDTDFDSRQVTVSLEQGDWTFHAEWRDGTTTDDVRTVRATDLDRPWSYGVLDIQITPALSNVDIRVQSDAHPPLSVKLRPDGHYMLTTLAGVSYDVAVSARDYEPWTTRVELQSDRPRTLTVNLQPLAPAVPPQPAPPSSPTPPNTSLQPPREPLDSLVAVELAAGMGVAPDAAFGAYVTGGAELGWIWDRVGVEALVRFGRNLGFVVGPELRLLHTPAIAFSAFVELAVWYAQPAVGDGSYEWDLGVRPGAKVQYLDLGRFGFWLAVSPELYLKRGQYAPWFVAAELGILCQL